VSRWKAIMVDLDGTLCDASHRVHHVQNKPKNWDAFYAGMGEDEIVSAVASVLHMSRLAGLHIVYLTGRPDNYRTLTEEWLQAHALLTDDSSLIMRRAGDFRTDDIVKCELYQAEVEPMYDITFVLEDRARVVKMWRELGLVCFQVADGDF
jgi:hypothetical protein